MIASPLLRLEAASAGYTAEQPVLGGLDLRIDNDDRIALLGQNGNGKSTVAKLIAGKLKPLSMCSERRRSTSAISPSISSTISTPMPHPSITC